MEGQREMTKEIYNRAKTTHKISNMYGFRQDLIDIYSASYDRNENGDYIIRQVKFEVCGIKYKSNLIFGDIEII